MKQVVIRQGKAVVEEVPAPGVEAGRVLVRVEHSCISSGTELGAMRSGGDPLWKRALRDPSKVIKVLEMVASRGLSHAVQAVEGKLQSGDPTGYSASGTVIEAGAGVDDIFPGERVACAGSLWAHHAGVISVPRNLCVTVPRGLDSRVASTVTLGAIALQGVRRARPTLGETFAVIGLGIIGQLSVQLLRAHGCRAIGLDLERSRIRLALDLGMEEGLHPDDGDGVEAVARLSGGAGADGVIVTAASPSDEIISAAFRMCRRKGRVVLVGDVGLNLDRADFYAKELDFLVSTSYGPGRYDRRYEEEGLDYPLAYVRWTENRNMAEYLRLAAEGKLSVDPLIADVFPVDEAPAAYAKARAGGPAPIVLLSFPAGEAPERVRSLPNPFAVPRAEEGAVRLALVGAGGFARGTHLPLIREMGDLYRLRAVVSRSGHNADAVARQYGADWAGTDFSEVLRDAETDAVLIATRHNLHASMALAALRAGKHVLLEKPLALTREELGEVEAFYASREKGERVPMLMTGFNRRFAPAALAAAELLASRREPLVVDYRMNAGFIPADHWVHGPEGGGRNLGEACHVYDLFGFLTGGRVVSVQAASARPRGGCYSARDNFAALVVFDDGSLASLTYTAMGHRDHPKERMEIYTEGKVLVMDDWRRLDAVGMSGGWKGARQDKGHRGELAAFARAVREGGEWPVPLWQQVQATAVALEVEERLSGPPADHPSRRPAPPDERESPGRPGPGRAGGD